jgi:hypothetical protein
MRSASLSLESPSLQDIVQVYDGRTTVRLLKSALSMCFGEAMDKATIVSFMVLACDDAEAWPEAIERSDIELLLQLQAGAGTRKRPADAMWEQEVAAQQHGDDLDLSLPLQEPTARGAVSASPVNRLPHVVTLVGPVSVVATHTSAEIPLHRGPGV